MEGNKPKLTSAGEDMEKSEPSHAACGDGNNAVATEKRGSASKS